MFNYFKPLDNKWKLYRALGIRRDRAVGSTESLLYDKVRAQTGYATLTPPHHASMRSQEEDRTLDRLLQGMSGTGLFDLAFIVNEQMALQYVAGDTDGFFKVPSGKAENSISKMAVKELTIPLSTGIQKAFNKHEEVLYSKVALEQRDGPKTYNLRIKPLAKKKGQLPLVGVLIIEDKTIPLPAMKGGATKDAATHVYDASKEAQQRIVDLEQSLQFHKENLQATVEELETSNEELQASNEELMASNEELQSTNEELQSVNEELYTVNAEYQSKIVELTELNNDLENLNASTRIATVFLDENFEIRKFTPTFASVYKIIESDVGRPFSHLSHYLVDIEPYEVIKEVARSGELVEIEVSDEQNYAYLMRVLPYYIAPDVHSGVLLSFIDISNLKSEKHERELIESVLDGMNDGLVVCNSKGMMEHVNSTVAKIFGYSETEMLGQSVNMLMFEKEAKEHDRQIMAHIMSDRHVDACGRRVVGRHCDGSGIDLHINLSESYLEGEKYFTAVIKTKD